MNCHVCNSQNTVSKKQINKYGTAPRLLGYIIALPNLFILTTLLVSWAVNAGSEGSGVVAGLGFFVLMPMFLFMLLGLALLGKKKALVCGKCGYKMDAE